jgi:hypothetical protein
MLLVTPIIVRSNLPDVIGGGDDDDFLTGGEGAQKDSSAVEEKIQSQTMKNLKETLKQQIVRTSSAE